MWEMPKNIIKPHYTRAAIDPAHCGVLVEVLIKHHTYHNTYTIFGFFFGAPTTGSLLTMTDALFGIISY